MTDTVDENNQATETLLDESLKAALEDARQVNYFYDTLLNSDLYFPVAKQGTKEGSWTCLGMEDRFFPLFLQYPKGKALPVFDTLDRMKHWAGEKKLDFLVLRSHMLLGLVDPTVALVLNLGTVWNYTVTPEVLERLRAAMAPVTPS